MTPHPSIRPPPPPPAIRPGARVYRGSGVRTEHVETAIVHACLAGVSVIWAGEVAVIREPGECLRHWAERAERV
jgi:hypothetical protein